MSLKTVVCISRGFTLLEVLITLLVMSIGLLGLAALQISSLRNNQSAGHRGQAVELVRSMSDRMRSNAPYLRENNGGIYISTEPEDAAQQVCTSASECTQAQIAQHDLFEWQQNIALLPNGNGDITVTGAASTAVYTVSVDWLDVSGSQRASNAGNTSFSMEFQP